MHAIENAALDLSLLTAAYLAWGDARLCEGALWMASLAEDEPCFGHTKALPQWMPAAAQIVSECFSGTAQSIVLLTGDSTHAQFGYAQGSLSSVLGVPLLGAGSVSAPFAENFNTQLTHRVRSMLGLVSLREHCRLLAHECLDEWALDLAQQAVDAAPCAILVPRDSALAAALEQALEALAPCDALVRRSLSCNTTLEAVDAFHAAVNEAFRASVNEAFEAASDAASEAASEAPDSASSGYLTPEEAPPAQPLTEKPLTRKEKRAQRKSRFAFWQRGKPANTTKK